MTSGEGYSTLAWSDKYAIGVPELDGQHKILVGLINKLGSICVNEPDGAELRAVLDELARYTQYHFGNEEKLMAEHQINSATRNAHLRAHGQFRHQISLAAQIIEQAPHQLDALIGQLLEYLTQWLVHHIMGSDVRMVREIQALQAGAGHEDASRQAVVSTVPSADTLIDTLNALYNKIGDKTLELIQKDRKLEAEQKAMRALNEQLDHRIRELESQKFALDQHAIVSIADTAGFITYVNEKFCQISQYPREQLIGRNHNILNSGLHDKVFFRDLWTTINAGKVWQGEIRNRKMDGSFYWVSSTIVPFMDEAQKPYQFVSIRTDITLLKKLEEALSDANAMLAHKVEERTSELTLAKEALERDIDRRKVAEEHLSNTITELQQLNKKFAEAQNQLMQSEKMASIGQLAAGVAHEINNPIGYVNSNLGALEKYHKDVFLMLQAYEQAEPLLASDPVMAASIKALREKLDIDYLKQDIAALMKESWDGILRVKNIVQNLKDFSHVDATDEWKLSNLHHGLNSTLNIVNNEIKYKAEVVKAYGDIPEVECLPSQLNQVFMNLLVNAAHAIEQRGTITIHTGQQDGWVWVEISDTGKGIAPEHMQKIFDPFFTTKPVGKGTGLGLSLSYGIVQKHHGHIEVKSEPGKGAAFKVWLPVKQPEP